MRRLNIFCLGLAVCGLCLFGPTATAAQPSQLVNMALTASPESAVNKTIDDKTSDFFSGAKTYLFKYWPFLAGAVALGVLASLGRRRD